MNINIWSTILAHRSSSLEVLGLDKSVLPLADFLPYYPLSACGKVGIKKGHGQGRTGRGHQWLLDSRSKPPQIFWGAQFTFSSAMELLWKEGRLSSFSMTSASVQSLIHSFDSLAPLRSTSALLFLHQSFHEQNSVHWMLPLVEESGKNVSLSPHVLFQTDFGTV